ncbi:hypothetical protein RD792_012603 [Penstemon davidsonii]|uniref:Glycosyltransferase n=1 Tax=Penstemon davidsonii TaxID=160366 RepID=A0ABR0CXD3_9LAMI|nr:hypothetical protein RD792_012603 [Penstemon davidsonii]
MGSINKQYSEEGDVVVLVVPFPLQGHLNQLLHLSRLISTRNVVVHFVGTTPHNHQARRRMINGCDDDPKSIANLIFHDFPSLDYQSPPPDPNSAIKFPSHLQPLIDATSLLRHPVGELIRRLSDKNRRVAIIYDSLMGSVVQDFVDFPNAEAYTFHSVSAFSIFFFLWENMGRPFEMDEEILKMVPSIQGCFTPEFVKFVQNQHGYMNSSSGRIYNTCRVIEKQSLDLLARTEISKKKKQWALGPFNPVNITTKSHECLNWLEKQSPNSVILVSFGTTTSLSDEQIKELAIGLEKSGVNFIWVLRDADKGDGDGEVLTKADQLLPDGYAERVKNRGIVLGDWAPQLEILGHFAIGGFLSHCGWNSCMESISMGVPIAAWPMHSDQPRNAVLVTKALKIGILVKEWDHRRDEIVKSSTVESALRRLMASEEGEEMRKRAAEMGADVRNAVAEGGVTHMELESFISHIIR